MQPQRIAELPARVASKIKIDPDSGCWVWMASRRHGYGQSYGNGRRVTLAHRLVYELLVGAIPTGLELDHLCRNPPCCNPAHLEPVTHAENMRRGVWATRTHCPRGHLYDEQNTAYTKKGHRQCRECARRWARARHVPKGPRKRKTHCKHGHEFTPENTRYLKDGSRVCKACHRIAASERYHRLHPDAPYKPRS